MLLKRMAEPLDTLKTNLLWKDIGQTNTSDYLRGRREPEVEGR
jgi:hypothetical protein